MGSKRQVTLGKVTVGGGAPVSVQSMTNTDTRDVAATVAQVKQLEEAGCEIVRVAVVDSQAAAALGEICRRVNVPLVADIHFDYRLALAALEAGVDGLRLNPGNIGGRERVRTVSEAAKKRKVPIRIGVNAGSLQQEILERYGGVTPEALVASALEHIRMLEEWDFYQVKVSLKASHVPTMVAAYRLMASQSPYPLHLGVTEAGTLVSSAVKSSLGIGILLAEGIGDTIRVSITGDPDEEVRVGYDILRALDLRSRGVEVISCPTCGRCQVNLAGLAREVEKAVLGIATPMTVAVMGCTVNGPGEARQADVGVAGGRHAGLIFRHGTVVGRVREEEILPALLKEIKKIEQEKNKS